jgi:uncharacterized membrane protein YphA (DoxX/SURF4 family)
MDQAQKTKRLQTGVALLRITLGIIILVTWYDNLQKDLYTADGLVGFINWLFDNQNGNASSLNFYKSILDATIVPLASLFAPFQMIAELLMGLGLLIGGFTTIWGIGAMLFFLNLFLAYFGGQEWIWVYVLLFMSALTVTLSRAGRRWGIDEWILARQGEPPSALLW